VPACGSTAPAAPVGGPAGRANVDLRSSDLARGDPGVAGTGGSSPPGRPPAIAPGRPWIHTWRHRRSGDFPRPDEGCQAVAFGRGRT
ncbi:hypothetical protein SB717_37225, partial [Priestia sp. SIMBA_032]|uniref:hypothetical protein n=1 Tax=Priestia sp. SIMBA_032 TaxID=3085775 RepID=UPI00397C1D73